jgi:hypothetical protein
MDYACDKNNVTECRQRPTVAQQCTRKHKSASVKQLAETKQTHTDELNQVSSGSPITQPCATCSNCLPRQELKQMSPLFKKQRPPFVCVTCLELLQAPGNVLCTRRVCFCSHATGTTLCPKHNCVEGLRDAAGNSLFQNESKPAAGSYAMCVSCRSSEKVSKASTRGRAKKRKLEFTKDEKKELHVNYRNCALPQTTICKQAQSVR